MSEDHGMAIESSEPPQTQLPPFTVSRYGTAEEALRASNGYWKARVQAAEAEIERLQGIISASEERSKDWAAVEYAAHMPDDYKFGLPSWINQHLYAAYIEQEQDRAAAARWEEIALKQSEALGEAIELIEATYGEGHEEKWHRREERGDFAVKWLAKYKPEEKASGATT